MPLLAEPLSVHSLNERAIFSRATFAIKHDSRFQSKIKEDNMADVTVSDSDWQALSGDDQSGIMNAVSQTLGFNVAPAGGGLSLTSLQAANTAAPTGSNPSCEADCQTIRDKCLAICEGMRDPRAHDACQTVCWASFGICLVECAAGI